MSPPKRIKIPVAPPWDEDESPEWPRDAVRRYAREFGPADERTNDQCSPDRADEHVGNDGINKASRGVWLQKGAQARLEQLRRQRPASEEPERRGDRLCSRHRVRLALWPMSWPVKDRASDDRYGCTL